MPVDMKWHSLATLTRVYDAALVSLSDYWGRRRPTARCAPWRSPRCTKLVHLFYFGVGQMGEQPGGGTDEGDGRWT
jgi:hypothetical protein